MTSAPADAENQYPAEVGRPSPADADGPANFSRIRQAFLATKRGELLTPVHAVIDVCERLLADQKQGGPEDFVNDLNKIQAAGQELAILIDEALTPSMLKAAATDTKFEALQSRFRHDILNKLNPIINYSEMWLEEAAEHSLDAYIPDLNMICNSGKRCLGLIDQILNSQGMNTVVLPDWDLEPVTQAIRHMFDDPETRSAVAETGHLLVVDDNPTNREILQRRLEPRGHRVSLAGNGREALEMLQKTDFDLVLLDIVMPEMDGYDVLRKLKSDPRLRDVPVVMISSLQETAVVVRCIEAGADDYLPKPFNPVILHARIGACLEKRRLREREVEHLRQIEREKQHADELLHVILPSEIVTELKTTNAVTPRRYDDVAVLFADIVNFTGFCDQNPAEDVLELLQKLVAAWEESALRYGVEKIKTIGDAFMAAGGLLKKADNPVRSCVRCGLEMIQATREISQSWDLRVGIHCGQVVAGVLGRRQYQYDLWGDTVNTASRIESHGLPGAVTLSAQAWAEISPFCVGTSLGSVPVKGKGMLELVRFDRFDETAPILQTETSHC